MKMVRIRDNGEVTVVPYLKDIKDIQELVGGYVRPLFGIKGDIAMLVDEDGNYKGLKANSVASVVAGQPIVGCVVIVNTNATKAKVSGRPLKFLGFEDNKAKEIANRIVKGNFI